MLPHCFLYHDLLLPADRSGVKDAAIIQKLGERMDAALRAELAKNHMQEEAQQIRTILVDRVPVLHLLSTKHNDLLHVFKANNPTADFPALHKELFSQDGADDMQ